MFEMVIEIKARNLVMTPENENENEEEEEDDRRASSVAMPTRVCVLLTFRVAVQIDHSMGGEVRRVEQLRGALLSVNPHAFAFVAMQVESRGRRHVLDHLAVVVEQRVRRSDTFRRVDREQPTRAVKPRFNAR